MTPMTEAIAAIQLNSSDPRDKATAVRAGNNDCGRDIGLALSIQNDMVFFIG